MKVSCSGMERSGSTVAWQITQYLTKQTCPKTHLYIPGKCEVLYTYRHPAECYISFRDRLSKIYPTSVARQYARERLESQIDVFESFTSDLNDKNRKVLILRYEDYYSNPEKRVKDIAEWLGVGTTDADVAAVLDATSIEKNMTAGDFSHFDKKTGLHGTHINPDTKGEPGSLLRLADDDPYLTSSALRLLCKKFGYSY